MKKPGTCQRFLVLQGGLLLEAPHHAVLKEKKGHKIRGDFINSKYDQVVKL